MNKLCYSVMTAAILATVAVPAFAKGEGLYLGASIGQAEDQDSCNDLAATGFTGSCDDKDTGWKLFGGYQFTPNWGVEGYYADFGKTTASGTLVVPPPVAFTGEAKANALGVAATGTLPLGNSFGVFAKLGFHYWDAEVTGTGGGVVATVDDTGTDIMYGVGARYSFSDNLFVRAEWERFKVGDNKTTGKTDIDLLTVGIGYTF